MQLYDIYVIIYIYILIYVLYVFIRYQHVPSLVTTWMEYVLFAIHSFTFYYLAYGHYISPFARPTGTRWSSKAAATTRWPGPWRPWMGHGVFPHANLGRVYLPLESGCLNPAPRSTTKWWGGEVEGGESHVLGHAREGGQRAEGAVMRCPNFWFCLGGADVIACYSMLVVASKKQAQRGWFGGGVLDTFQLVQPGDARGGNPQWNEGGHLRPPKRCSQVDERPKGRGVLMGFVWK